MLRQHHRAPIGAVLLAAVLGGSAAGQAGGRTGDSEPRYVAQTIPTFGGGSTQAYDINNSGQVVGSSLDSAGNFMAFLWEGGDLVSLGTLPGYTGSIAWAISEDGEIVGSARTPAAEQMGFRWSNGHMTPLGTLGGPQSGAADVSFGEVVGWAMVGNASRRFLGFRDSGSGMQALGVLPGGTWSTVSGISDWGEIVGSASSRRIHTDAVVFQRDGGLDPLPGLSPLGASSGVRDVNGAGVLVGWSENGELYRDVWGDRWAQRATRWVDGVATDLGTFGGHSSMATCVNAAGDIVGWAADDQEQWRAALWRGDQRFDLNDLVTRLADGVLVNAEGINERGQIIATLRLSGGIQTALLLTPVN